MKSDVQFTVFRHKRPREAVSSNSLSSFGSDASLNQSGVIAGVDAVVVEKPRHCVDGESIQVCMINYGFFSRLRWQDTKILISSLSKL